MLRYGHGSVTFRPIRKSWQTTTNQPWGEINWRAPILDTKYLKILSQKTFDWNHTWIATVMSEQCYKEEGTDGLRIGVTRSVVILILSIFLCYQSGLWDTLYYDCIPTVKYSIISVHTYTIFVHSSILRKDQGASIFCKPF